MNTAKVYHDEEGNPRTIHQMVMEEPHWAANRIQVGEEALAEVELLKRMYSEQCDLVSEFQAATGILIGGDPGEVTPEMAERETQRLWTVVDAARSLRQGACSGANLTEMQQALEALGKALDVLPVEDS